MSTDFGNMEVAEKLRKSVTKNHLPHTMYYETEASVGSGGFVRIF